jgi:hypothetical protein
MGPPSSGCPASKPRIIAFKAFFRFVVWYGHPYHPDDFHTFGGDARKCAIVVGKSPLKALY